MSTPLPEFVAGLAAALATGQELLDDASRDGLDRFSDTGIPPTAYTWGRVRLSATLGLAVSPKREANDASYARLSCTGGGRLSIGVRYLLSPQGGDDPRPITDRLEDGS